MVRVSRSLIQNCKCGALTNVRPALVRGYPPTRYIIMHTNDTICSSEKGTQYSGITSRPEEINTATHIHVYDETDSKFISIDDRIPLSKRWKVFTENCMELLDTTNSLICAVASKIYTVNTSLDNLVGSIVFESVNTMVETVKTHIVQPISATIRNHNVYLVREVERAWERPADYIGRYATEVIDLTERYKMPTFDEYVTNYKDRMDTVVDEQPIRADVPMEERIEEANEITVRTPPILPPIFHDLYDMDEEGYVLRKRMLCCTKTHFLRGKDPRTGEETLVPYTTPHAKESNLIATLATIIRNNTVDGYTAVHEVLRHHANRILTKDFSYYQFEPDERETTLTLAAHLAAQPLMVHRVVGRQETFIERLRRAAYNVLARRLGWQEVKYVLPPALTNIPQL